MPLLFANSEDRFSRVEANIVITKYTLINFIINPTSIVEHKIIYYLQLTYHINALLSDR